MAEEGNAKLNKLVAQAMPDIVVLKDIASKNRDCWCDV